MKKTTITATMLCSMIFAVAGSIAYAESPIDPCLNCHTEETPKIVKQWEAGKHSKTGVKCFVCHYTDESNVKAVEHNDFFIVSSVDEQTCVSCHPKNGKELLRAFTKKSGKHP